MTFDPNQYSSSSSNKKFSNCKYTSSSYKSSYSSNSILAVEKQNYSTLSNSFKRSDDEIEVDEDHFLHNKTSVPKKSFKKHTTKRIHRKNTTDNNDTDDYIAKPSYFIVDTSRKMEQPVQLQMKIERSSNQRKRNFGGFFDFFPAKNTKKSQKNPK